jgi:hypothetical protein
MAVGIGFAVLENAFLLLNGNSFHMLDAIARAFGAGLMHGMCTLLVGVGISFVKKRQKLFAVGTFALLSTAITYHGIYNMLVQSNFEIIGYLLPITVNGFLPGADYDYSALEKKEPNKTMLIPLIIFAVLAVLLGMFPNLLTEYLSQITAAVL